MEIELTRDEIILDIFEELEDMEIKAKREFLENLSDNELIEFRRIIFYIQFARYFIPVDDIDYIINRENY